MTVPAAKTSLIDPIVANDFNWPRTYVYVGTNVFDSSPSTGQRNFRNDRGEDYYYDGTRWLSVITYTATFKYDGTYPISASGNMEAKLSRHSLGSGVYLLTLERTFQPSVAQSVSNNYSFSMFTVDGSNTVTGITTPASTASCTTGSR